MKKNADKSIELWFDKDEALTDWDTDCKYNIVLVEHGNLSLKVGDHSILCAAPALLFVKQNSSVEFVGSTLLKASRILFESVFININLVPERICIEEYRQLFREHKIDKLDLFEKQNEHFFGLLPLSHTVCKRMSDLFLQIKNNLKDTEVPHWRCNVRDPLLAVLTLAEVVRREFTGNPTFLPGKNKPEFFIPAVIEFLHSNYSRKVTIEQLCALVGVNRNELSRQFKFYSKKTIVEYLMDCRLNHAVNSLLATERTLYEISRECGFNSESYFVRIFKRKFNKSPTEYRKFHVDARKAALNDKYFY